MNTKLVVGAIVVPLHYDDAAVTFSDVLEAQRDLLEAEQQLVQKRRALLANRVILHAALVRCLGRLVLTQPFR